MGFYPTREAVQKLLGFETATTQPNHIQHHVVTILLFTILTILGIVVRSLGKVYALIGGFAATFLAYILPAMACLITRRHQTTSSFNNTPILDDAKTPFVDSYHSTTTASSSSTTRRSEQKQVGEEEIRNEERIVSKEDHDLKFGLLDASAIFLVIWGIVVMIFATSGVFK
ncbi:uncharacterized protein BX663DRAFT_254162 [Cokeromyces recurvatus]|uniref:uncharacterized protein n=1 Tax=Cokeromyces recurvatus TaxID=90255 RepID=UPI00221E7999|nr:uncharacterized protein BX663DRAFT_254162 [Cokeromyces recurvatus]KAI7906162.1 hypothetical protein BX663DRAFT_254162 [Cokeromyces recurvatus]